MEYPGAAKNFLDEVGIVHSSDRAQFGSLYRSHQVYYIEVGINAKLEILILA